MISNKEKGSKTVISALALLDYFSLERQQIGLSEFVSLSGMPKANVLRHLSALEKAGFIKQDKENKKYQLGFKVMELAYLAKKQIKMRDIILPYMKDLKDITGETVCLQVLDGEHGICIERLEPNNNLVYLPPIGSREYLHGGASRKVLLSFLPDERIEDIISKGLFKLASNTVIDTEQLWQDINAIREKGYSITVSEHVEGVVAISAPIRNDDGSVAASLSVVGPEFRLTEEKKSKCLDSLLETVKQISRELGFKN